MAKGSGKVVRRSVVAINQETGEEKWYHDGDTLDPWAEKYITNPRVFQPLDGDEALPENLSVEGDVGAPDYDNMNISELDEHLEERGLAKTGNKGEKVQRLKDHDASLG